MFEKKTGVIPKEMLPFFHGVTGPSLGRKRTILPSDHEIKPLLLWFPISQLMKAYLRDYWNLRIKGMLKCPLC